MKTSAQVFISEWLKQRLNADEWSWLLEQLEAINRSNSKKHLYIALGVAPRRLGKNDLDLSEAELYKAVQSVPGLNPTDWSVDGAARTLMLLELTKNNPDDFGQTFRSLCATADVSEAISYYRALMLYPQSKALRDQVGEGLRTNMRAVFEAIAHKNPYPAEYLDEHSWNHMILKALFVGSKLNPIQGLDQRSNPELAEILCNYAHERWAAGRTVTAELWRCVGPHADEKMLVDIVRATQSAEPIEHCGAVLALSQSPLSSAAKYLANYPNTAQSIASGDLTWETLAMEPGSTSELKIDVRK